MGENSSGTNPEIDKNPSLKEQFSRKTRSFSLGSMKYSPAEINKIIGDNNQKGSTEIKTYVNKQHRDKNGSDDINKEQQLQGVSNKFKSHEQQEADNIFTPSKKIGRSPPTKGLTTNINVTNENVNKRSRIDTSPVMENQKKKHASDQENLQRQITQENREIETRTQTDPIDMETLLMGIFEALDKIQNITDKEEQEMVRVTTNDIHRGLIQVAYRIGQLEKENQTLEYKIQIHEIKTNQENTNTPVENVENCSPQQKTYATITQTSNERNNETWKTPKTSKKLETLIQIDNISNSKDTIQQLKKEIGTNDIDGGFKNIRQLKNGAIIVESSSENQRKKLKSVLESKTNIKMKESSTLNPMFTITGILKGYSDEEFVEELIRLNPEIKTEFKTMDIQNEIKIVAKKQCRNPSKENWILESQPAITKWFLKKQTVYFDLMRVYVQEHINLALCFKCAGFGHVAKYCEGKRSCHKCGDENHEGKECTTTELKCPNCIKMKYKAEDSKHSARDIKCPIYQKRLIMYRNQINYSDNFL